MANWPSIAYPSDLEEEIFKKVARSDFEAGYVCSVASHTRSRRRWVLSWSVMSAADLASLQTFFDNNQGDTFSWTNPANSTGYTVRFSEDMIKAKYVSPGYYKVQVDLEEQ